MKVQRSSADIYGLSDLFEAASVPVTSDLLEHRSREAQDDHDCGDLLESPSWHHPLLIPSATQAQATVKHPKHAYHRRKAFRKNCTQAMDSVQVQTFFMLLAMRATLARAKTKLHSAEKMAASVRGLIIANRRSLGRRANHAPTTVGTVQISNPTSEPPAPTIPRILKPPYLFVAATLGNNAGAGET